MRFDGFGVGFMSQLSVVSYQGTAALKLSVIREETRGGKLDGGKMTRRKFSDRSQ
jgi:hypothetical protein